MAAQLCGGLAQHPAQRLGFALLLQRHIGMLLLAAAVVSLTVFMIKGGPAGNGTTGGKGGRAGAAPEAGSAAGSSPKGGPAS